MKKLAMILTFLLSAALLFAACKENIPNPTVDTVPPNTTVPTEAPTDPTELPTVPTDPPTNPPTVPTEPPTIPTDPPADPTEPTVPIPTVSGNPLEYQSGTIKLWDQDSDDYDFIRKYRHIYYTIESEFVNLLDDAQRQDFSNWIWTFWDEIDDEMALAAFVLRYEIPQEEFERALDLCVSNHVRFNHDMTHEQHEVPNADVIYTFDNELINRYYRYE